ncbi:MAG: hypothetical protein HY473_01505 [Candidatus Sungbacteria bacterium]|uniref:Uncharacterized protein n=1 Tax=Candidatus Sungiibacteriota bacterium TaxID=2750080 RepID=A0A933DRW6_9BACT|nr:hypothetical protein [Candidatus Sungbacteria bacterium]
MALATTQGKDFALRALAERREWSKTRERIDNGRGYAGDPMHFDCITCGGDIVVPENYINRPKLCRECTALKDAGWLE